MLANQKFIHLRVHSSYSLSQGAIKIPQMMELCQKHKMPAIAITDTNNLFAALEFSQAALKKGVQPIVGMEISCDFGVAEKPVNFNFHKMVLLAKNEQGFQSLINLSSNAFINHAGEDEVFVNAQELKENAAGLIALSGGHESVIDTLILAKKVQQAEEFLIKFKEMWGADFYLEFNRFGYEFEADLEAVKLGFAQKYNVPIVATNNAFFTEAKNFEAHDALLCIADGRYIVEEDRPRLNDHFHLKSPRKMIELFRDLPEAIENSVLIAKSCGFGVSEHAPMLPSFKIDGLSEEESLRLESKRGLKERFAKDKIDDEQFAKYLERLNYELEIIIKMGFPGYFLIVSDFIKWSKQNNIAVGPGRGSGAGSLVAWSLQITDLDPIKFGLIFERFLNPERVSMPDFDIDFCQEKRDQVIDYVQKKYGNDKVAQIITFGKLQARAVIRDVGRVMQMPYGEVDRISKMVPFNPVNPVDLTGAIEMEPMLRKAARENKNIDKLLDIALKLEGLNRHASTHAAGVVIADRPLSQILPLYRDAKSEMLIVQYSMKYAEAAGLVKFDFLGLKTLTLIDACIGLVQENLDIEIDIGEINLFDEKTFEMLSKGASIGVFQFESAGMRDALCKMQPDCIEDLIALGALYRPGPMDNIPRYIACKHGLEEPDYLHPKLEEVLKETFGVIIYQEQVMKIAQILAGYTLGAADLLRRAMGKKIKAEMDAQREIFVSGSVANGLTKKRASEIFDLVAKFAGYGFNKSHAAAYGMISYQTAFLKANYPLEFIVASLNLEINDTDKIVIFIQEAKNLGLEILPPCVNHSMELFAIEDRKLRYGLGALKGASIAAMKDLRSERQENGKFKSLDDFISRVGSNVLNKRQLESLIKAGAFDDVYENRCELFESVDFILKQGSIKNSEQELGQFNLFAGEAAISVEAQIVKKMPWKEDQKFAFEASAIGFYLTGHPVDKFKIFYETLNIHTAKYLINELENGSHSVKICGVIISHKTRVSPKGRYVTVQMSDPTALVEFSVFDDELLAGAANLFSEKAAIMLEAEIRKDEGGIRVNARNIIDLNKFFKNNLFEISCLANSVKFLEELKKNQATETDDCFVNCRFNLQLIHQSHQLTLDIPEIYKVHPYLFFNLKKCGYANEIKIKQVSQNLRFVKNET